MPIDKTYIAKNRMAIGDAEWDVGGALNINTGGVLQIEAGGQLLESVGEGLTAHAGGGQASAFLCPALINRFTTVATAGDSAKLPPSQGITGATIVTINAGASAMQVFGFGTDTINGVASGTGVSVAAGKTAAFFTTLAGTWHMQLSA